MGLFDKFFKKKEESHYDSTDIRVQDLDVGFVFDYDLETWEVQAIYEYDWGDQYFTREFKVSNGTRTVFLAMEEDDELELSVSKKVKVRALGDNALEDFMAGNPPKKLTYQDQTYYLEEESPGYFHDISKGDDAWEEFVSWDYEDEEGENLITVEQWGEKDFEASAGYYIDEFEISNILPGTDK